MILINIAMVGTQIGVILLRTRKCDLSPFSLGRFLRSHVLTVQDGGKALNEVAFVIRLYNNDNINRLLDCRV